MQVVGRRSKSKRQWISRQQNDTFSQKAKKEGYRSRAVYKLLEIHLKDKLFRHNMIVVDLGAAPGGWSQVAVNYLCKTGCVIALDILPMDPLDGVDIITGDLHLQSVVDELYRRLNHRLVDLVISDMAPNFSGISNIDQLRSVSLAELGLNFARDVLDIGGSLLVKLFQGEGFIQYLHTLKQDFAFVVVRKPKASRAESREVYLLAKKFKQ